MLQLEDVSSLSCLPILIAASQIHASQATYGEVLYLRLVDIQGQSYCFFLIGKSRLATFKDAIIPRLELMAASSSSVQGLEEGIRVMDQ